MIVITGHGYHKVLQFAYNTPLRLTEENKYELAVRIKTLTGDWVSEVNCADIRKDGR